jgi:hypothetical protein
MCYKKNPWQITESCTPGSGETSVWLPITVFHASLVARSTTILDGDTRGRGSLKVLAFFRMEPGGMKWPRCFEVADVLDSLIKGEHNVPAGD